jgi:lipopolysaccharide/colanic/teichoic acid biosynthesis glycosyltransferase
MSALHATGRLTTEVLRVPEECSAGSQLWFSAERVLAGALLIALLPALAAVSLAVAIVSRKSPFIAHRRLGHHGQEFWMLKIRTMWDRHQAAAPKRRGWIQYVIEYLSDTHVPVFKGTRDPRVTSRLAVFCRRFSLDELPQLIHVLSGRMRLVGPRPITREEWDEYYGPSSAEVLAVRPGMTGLWQVLGRNRLTYGQRRRLDLFYARHWRPRLDLLLLWRTPIRVLSGRDAG